MDKRTKIALLITFGIPLVCCGGPFLILQGAVFSNSRGTAEDLAALKKNGFPTTIQDIQRPLPPESENAAPLYRAWIAEQEKDPELRRAMDRLETLRRPDYSPERSQQAEEAYARAAVFIPTVRAIANRPLCNFKRDYSQGFSMLLPEYVYMKRATKLMAVHAEHQSQKGDWKGALESLKAGLAFGHHAGQEPFLIGVLVNIACESIVDQTLAGLIYKYRNNPEFLDAAKRLRASYPPPPDLRAAMGVEFVMSKQTIENLKDLKEITGSLDPDMQSQAPPNPFGPTLMSTLRPVAVARLVKAYRKIEPGIYSDPRRWKDSRATLLKLQTELDSNNDILETLNKILMPVFDGTANAFGAVEARRTMLDEAIRIYRRAGGGKIPSETVFPADPFGTGSLNAVISGDKMLIYSVGQNGVDDQGSNSNGGDDVRLIFGPSNWPTSTKQNGPNPL